MVLIHEFKSVFGWGVIGGKGRYLDMFSQHLGDT